MRKQEGSIVWDVVETVENGHTVTNLHFHKQTSGEFAGRYHGYFWMLPMVFLSQFIEPSYTLWRAWAGDELIDSNLVFDAGGNVLSPIEAEAAVEEFANA